MNRFDKYRGKSSNLPAPSGTSSTPATREERERILGQPGKGQRSSTIDQLLNKHFDFAICLDATGSMSGLIEDAKASIAAIIERVTQYAQTKIRLRIFVYRDYDVEHRVLELSPLSSDHGELTAWLRGVHTTGGGGNDGEAIEQALQAILRGDDYSGVLLAGDEPPNSRSDLDGRGKSQEPTALDWAKRLGEKQIPIHTFIVGDDPRTVADFKTIARLSGGQSGRLDGSSEMIDMAVMAILAKLKGASAVKKYAEGQQLSTNARSFQHLLLTGPTRK